MACASTTLNGIGRDCQGTSKGGVRNVYIAPVDGTENVTITTEKVTDLSNKAKFKKYYFKKGAASMTSTLNVDVQNGVNYVSTELNLTFTKMNTTKRIEISALSLADVMIVVEDSNGHFWLLGNNEPVTVTAATSQTGQAKTDGNFYQITFTDESDTFPYELDETLVASLLEGITETAPTV